MLPERHEQKDGARPTFLEDFICGFASIASKKLAFGSRPKSDPEASRPHDAGSLDPKAMAL